MNTSNLLVTARLVTAVFAVGLCIWLWVIKRSAYEQVRQGGVNGAILALARERLRHRLFIVSMTGALLGASVLYGDARNALMTVVHIGFVLDAIQAFRARQLVQVLVNEYYERHGHGRRKTDPKPPPEMLNGGPAR